MQRTRTQARKSLIIMFVVVAALVYAGFKYFYRPQSADIFLISPTELEYGETTISGTLNKETAIGEAGRYLLILPDTRVVVLQAEGLDALVGSSVTVTGVLLPAINDTVPMNMTMETIVVN